MLLDNNKTFLREIRPFPRDRSYYVTLPETDNTKQNNGVLVFEKGKELGCWSNLYAEELIILQNLSTMLNFLVVGVFMVANCTENIQADIITASKFVVQDHIA